MRKMLSVILSFFMLILLSTSASALDHAQYGLEAQVTPNIYSNGVSFSVKIENISKENIDSVSVETSFPKGLSPVSSTFKDFSTIKPEEIGEFTVNATLSSTPLTLNIGEKAHHIPISTIAVSTIAVIAIIALLILAIKNKSFRKICVLFLCITLAVPHIGFIPTFAKDSNNCSFEINETVTLKGIDYTVNFKFSLASTDIESYLSCKNEESVDDATQDITGTIVSDEEIVSVDYEVYSEIDKGDLSFSGETKLDGGHYVITDTVLKPGNNEIKITTTTKSCKKITETFNICYNSSSIYEESENDISTDKDSGKKYINSIINVLFKENATDSEKDSVLKELNGEKVGYINGANMWQIKVEKAELDSLNSICESLSKKTFVASAYVDFLDISPNVIPDDPWGNSTWSEASPAGNNWSVEIVQALSAWDYDNYFNDINIGFVDTGCDYDHEDLNGKVIFTSVENEAICDAQKHGTHVAGIMGAIPNNKKGVTGTLWNGKLYAHDAKYKGANEEDESMTTTKCYNGVVQNIEAGAKVVNLSLGLSTLKTPISETDISNFSVGASSYVAYLLNQGYDFIICQSSGNGNSSGAAVDTRFNGMFCCIDQDETGQSAAMAKKIADRIMIVGSMGSGGSQASSSNYGAHVDLAAPGVNVYSTVIDDYDTLSGTSMASPLVAAILGVVWSVNPELSADEVVNIVKTTASAYRSAYPTVTGQTALPVPNLYTAVKAAIATLPATDFSELDEAIASVPANLSYYDTSSVKALNTALASAENLDRDTASQKQTNTVTQSLLDAIYTLKVSLASPAQLTIPEKLTVSGSEFPEVKFTCPGATDIKITFSNNNIIDTNQSGTTDTATVILSGNSLTKEDIGTITCTATYTYEGITHTLKRYIEVVDEIFATQPLVDTNIKRSGGNFLSGYYPSLYNIATITGTTRAMNPYANTSNGYFNFDTNSFVCNSDTAVGTQWGGYQLSGDAKSNLMDQSYAPKGYLYVDTSKYSQLSEIPDFALYIYQYKKCTRASGGTKVLSVTTDNQDYTVNVTKTTLGTSATSVSESQTYKINGPVPTKTTTVKFYIQTQAIAKGVGENQQTTTSAVFLELVIIPQYKAQLETLLDKLYSANHESLFYTKTSFENYSKALEEASAVCADPNSEQAEIDYSYENLKDAFLALKFDSKADYTKLNNALSAAGKIDADLYTDYSLDLFNESYYSASTLKDNYFKSYQSYIDSKAEELLNGMDSLLLCGDLNANGVVDGDDAFIMSCLIAGTLNKSDLGEYKYSAADVNKNSIVDIADQHAMFTKGLNP